MIDKVAVITVVYQNYEVLKDFLKSFEKQTSSNFHIFIVDLSKTKSAIQFPQNKQVTILSGKNKGYAYGVNLGLKKAISEAFGKFIVINSDTYVDEQFVRNSLSSIIHHPSSIMGGKIYYAPGYEFHKNKYKATELGKVIWYGGGSIDWKNVYVLHHGVDQVDKTQYNKFTKTGFVTGCLMCFDKTVIDKIGFWDERYFLYFEDSDYCQKAIKKGIELFYDPSIIIWHKNAQSTDGSGSTIHQKYQKVNRLIFGLKFAPFKTKLHVLFEYLRG